VDIPKYKAYNFLPKKCEYCLCVPVINEGERFKKFIKKLTGYSGLVDILVLDGGSTDGSVNKVFLRNNNVSSLLIIKEEGRLSSQLRMGYFFALKRGYKGVVTIDGNGKDDPKAIPLFVTLLKRGYDYLQGSRFMKKGRGINTPLARYLAIRFVHAPLLSLSSGFFFTDTTPGFRGYSSKLLKDQRLMIFRKIFTSYRLLAYITARAPRLGFRTKEVPITRRYPKKGPEPTKIRGLKGELELLLTLFKAALGFFNPRSFQNE